MAVESMGSAHRVSGYHPASLNRALLQIGIIIAITAFMGAFVSSRFKRAGSWLPDNIPNKIGYWEGADAPVPRAVLWMLKFPQAVGRKYSSPFGEQVEASVITAGEFENFHDPTVCVPSNGFVLTAKKIFNLNGCNIRAMVFKRGGMRMLMYYWQQTRNGQTDTAARMGNYRDFNARLQSAYGAVFLGQQTVLCRVYTMILPTDPKGVQAQRNVEEVSQALYRALKEDGKGG
jgi:hypothetical protein